MEPEVSRPQDCEQTLIQPAEIPLAYRWDGAAQTEILPSDGHLVIDSWNIQMGRSNGESRFLDHNLARGVHTPLDLQVLVEYDEAEIDPAVVALLDSSYAHSDFRPNNEKTGAGIRVLSKHSLTHVHEEPLPWTPLGASPAEAAAFLEKWQGRFNSEIDWNYTFKTYHEYELEVDGHKVIVVPVHALNPYSQLREHLERRGVPSLIAKTIVFGQIVMPVTDPLHNQMGHLVRTLKKRHGAHLSEKDIIVVGDFNSPARAPARRLGISSASYRLLSSALTDAMGGSYAHTWPTPSHPYNDRGYPPLKLDHVFSGGQFLVPTTHQILSLHGSDHKRVRVEFQKRIY